jgi:hypothetical protein
MDGRILGGQQNVAADVEKRGNSNKLLVESTSLPFIAYESEDQANSFLVASGFIALTTTGSFNGMLYMKNTDSQNRNFHIHHFRVCSGLGASASSTLQIQCKLNATAGTLISDANAATVTNMNTNSNKAFGGDVYAASGDGKTVTDGSSFTQFINRAPGHSIQDYDGSIVIGNGVSFTIECKPSEAQTVCIELIGYFK